MARRGSAADVTGLWIDQVPSPLGTLIIVAADDALCALHFAVARSRMLARIRSRFPGVVLMPRRDPNGYATRVHAYFAGDFGALGGIAVDGGGTSFQEEVWKALREIPAGTTTTYRALAEIVRRPRAVRAVGLANARNPVCLVIPCHRVLGSDGQLTGYAGGIWRKQWLLKHERVPSPSTRSRRRERGG
jgi:methylated-DNA-[protein]-cysteine S-methyltransferase